MLKCPLKSLSGSTWITPRATFNHSEHRMQFPRHAISLNSLKYNILCMQQPALKKKVSIMQQLRKPALM